MTDLRLILKCIISIKQHKIAGVKMFTLDTRECNITFKMTVMNNCSMHIYRCVICKSAPFVS